MSSTKPSTTPITPALIRQIAREEIAAEQNRQRGNLKQDVHIQIDARGTDPARLSALESSLRQIVKAQRGRITILHPDFKPSSLSLAAWRQRRFDQIKHGFQRCIVAWGQSALRRWLYRGAHALVGGAPKQPVVQADSGGKNHQGISHGRCDGFRFVKPGNWDFLHWDGSSWRKDNSTDGEDSQ